MGLKSIEMQVAIPRSQDAGKMQEHMERQGQQVQQTLTEEELKAEAAKRNKVNEYENVQISNDKEEKEEEQEKREMKAKKKKKNKESIDHPYLGNQIDFSG